MLLYVVGSFSFIAVAVGALPEWKHIMDKFRTRPAAEEFRS
jgi:hypothetical protein